MARACLSCYPSSMGLRTIDDILSFDQSDQETYLSDAQAKRYRKNKGSYSRNNQFFDFFYLVKNWESLVGRMLSENTIPIKVKGSTLLILTKHSIFSHELSYMAPQLIAKIDAAFPKYAGKIKKVKFLNGTYSSEQFNNTPASPPLKKTVSHSFNPKVQVRKQQAKEFFKDVEDEEMRELLEKLFILKE